MSKKLSILKATYGKLNEIDRSQMSRDASFARAQSDYDNMEADYSDFDEEDIYNQAAQLAMETAEDDAKQAGYENIDEYAIKEYGLQQSTTNDGHIYSPGEQLIDQNIEMYEDMIRRGEI
jgi:hypothetical protein